MLRLQDVLVRQGGELGPLRRAVMEAVDAMTIDFDVFAVRLDPHIDEIRRYLYQASLFTCLVDWIMGRGFNLEAALYRRRLIFQSRQQFNAMIRRGPERIR